VPFATELGADSPTVFVTVIVPVQPDPDASTMLETEDPPF
jgi:hypothetical protein